MQNLKETQIMQQVGLLLNAKGMEWTHHDLSHLLFSSVFTSISEYLSIRKNKQHKVAVSIVDQYSKFYGAAIVQYHENEDDNEAPGNYSYEITLSEKDLDDVTEVYNIFDNEFYTTAQSVTKNNFSFNYVRPEHLNYTCVSCFEAIINWLDTEAKEGEEVSVELEGYFQASVVIENGEKVFSIVPGAQMKQIIKGDHTIEK